MYRSWLFPSLMMSSIVAIGCDIALLYHKAIIRSSFSRLNSSNQVTNGRSTFDLSLVELVKRPDQRFNVGMLTLPL